MLIQALSPQGFDYKARQVMAHVPSVLRRWGLMPKFMEWRLAQDPSTGMIVLFGVLNDKHIASHTRTPFSAYFDPRLLHDLATDLHVQVVASDSHILRYAFVLDWGQLGISNQSTAGVGKALPLLATVEGELESHTVTYQRLPEWREILESNNTAALMPGLFLLPEEYDDVPNMSGGPRADFSEVADNLARVGRKWGIPAPADADVDRKVSRLVAAHLVAAQRL